jgi:hypothetical protein
VLSLEEYPYLAKKSEAWLNATLSLFINMPGYRERSIPKNSLED